MFDQMMKKPIFELIYLGKTKEKCIEIIYSITYLLGNTQWLNRIYGLLFMILNAFFGMQNYIRDMVNHNFITYNGRNCILGFA